MTKLKEFLDLQHQVIDAVPFHSLAALTELVKQAKVRQDLPLSVVRDNFTVDGLALRKKYNGGFCTTNTQALVQEAAKINARGYLLDVPYRNSLRPLKRELKAYEGPVHVDAAFVSEAGEAVHVVSGVGPQPEYVKHFTDVQHLRAHLLAEGYAPDAVHAIGSDKTPTEEDFNHIYRQQLAMRHVSYINDASRGVLGLNLVKGELFINDAARKAYSGPLLAAQVGTRGASWPLCPDDATLNVVDAKTGAPSTLSGRAALLEAAQRLGEQFAQPDDFAQNIVAVAEMREPLLTHVLAPSISHVEPALTNLPAWKTTSWPRIDQVSASVRESAARLLDERDPHISATFGAYFCDVLQVYAFLRLDKPTQADVDTLALQAAVVVGRTGADVAARLRTPGADVETALDGLLGALPTREALSQALGDSPDAARVDVMRTLLLDQIILGMSHAHLASASNLAARLADYIDAHVADDSRRAALHTLVAQIGERDEAWPNNVEPRRAALAHLDRTEGYYWANKPVRAALRVLPRSARALSTAGEVHWLNNNVESVFTRLRSERHSVDEILDAFSNQVCLPLAERYAGVALGEPMRALLLPVLARLGRVVRWQHEEALTVAPADPDKTDDLFAVTSFAEGIAREPRLRAAAADHLGLPLDATASELLDLVPAERLGAWLRSRHAFEMLEARGICVAQTLARMATATVAPLSDDSRDMNKPVSALRAIDAAFASGKLDEDALAHGRAAVLGLLMHPGYEGGRAGLPRVAGPLDEDFLDALTQNIRTLDQAADAHLAAQYGLSSQDLVQLARRRKSMRRALVANFAPTQMGRLALPADVQPSALTLEAKREAVTVYEGVRRFVQDPLRTLRSLQGLEAAVLQRHRDANVPAETAFMQLLEEAERAAGLGDPVPVTGGLAGQPFHKMLREGHPFDDIIFFSQPHGSKTHRLQNLLVMREMQQNPQAFGASVDNWGAFYKILGNRVLRRELGFPRGEQQEDLWRMLFDALHASNFGCADAVKSIASQYAPWLGDIEHTPLALTPESETP